MIYVCARGCQLGAHALQFTAPQRWRCSALNEQSKRHARRGDARGHRDRVAPQWAPAVENTRAALHCGDEAHSIPLERA